MSERVADVLGEPFVAETIDLPDDDEGAVVATLVHSPAVGDSPRRRAVLYVHGFCDYFFQVDLAAFCTARGFDFYALDLRKYGRSLRPHQTPNYILDLADYDAELDAAYERITERDGHDTVVVVAHSTGGLVTPLWADRRRSRGLPGPVAFVLNSPWFDLQGPAWQRSVGTWVVDVVGRARPRLVIPQNVTGLYGESLRADLRGEWTYDTAWKPPGSYPVRTGWLRAIRRGHARLHRGLDVGGPALVLRSDRSMAPQRWTDEVARTDVVLDVAHMAQWAHCLGSDVRLQTLPGALHEVFLSARPVREQAYAALGDFLDAV